VSVVVAVVAVSVASLMVCPFRLGSDYALGAVWHSLRSGRTDALPLGAMNPLTAIVLAAAETDPQTVVEVCGDKPSFFCEVVWNATGNEMLARAADWLIAKPLTAIVILLVAGILNHWLRKIVTAAVFRISSRNAVAAATFKRVGVTLPDQLMAIDPRDEAKAETLASVLRASVSTVVWTVAALMALGVFQIEIWPLIAGVGVMGIALGFGAQSLVRDCIAGFFILLEDQFGVGDEVNLGVPTGTVEAVTLRRTTVRSVDGTLWSVPNGSIVNTGNLSRAWVQCLIDVTIWYDADVDQAIGILDRVATEVCERADFADAVIEGPQVLGIERLQVDGVVLRVSVRVIPGRQGPLNRALRSAIKEALDGAGIAMHAPLHG